MVTWRKTTDPDLIESPPFFIRRRNGRYLLGRDMKHQLAECLGGFDSADEARAAADDYRQQEAA